MCKTNKWIKINYLIYYLHNIFVNNVKLWDWGDISCGSRNQNDRGRMLTLPDFDT